MPANTRIDDGNHKIAGVDGPPRFSQPFDGDPAFYVLDEDYVQYYDYFASLALNIPHPVYPSFLLCKESNLQPVGVAGVAKWTRTYAQVPATRNDPSTIAYNFIGYYGLTNAVFYATSGFTLGRARFTRSVSCRIQYDYYLGVDATHVYDSIGTNVAMAGAANVIDAIPVIPAQRYYSPIGTFVSGVFTPTYTAGSANDLAFGIEMDFIFDAGATSDAGTTLNFTRPSRTQYQTLVTAGTEIVAEGSQAGRWMGNIYFRTTKYIVAV